MYRIILLNMEAQELRLVQLSHVGTLTLRGIRKPSHISKALPGLPGKTNLCALLEHHRLSRTCRWTAERSQCRGRSGRRFQRADPRAAQPRSTGSLPYVPILMPPIG